MRKGRVKKGKRPEGFSDLFRTSDVIKMLNVLGLDKDDMQLLNELPYARIRLVTILKMMRLQRFLAGSQVDMDNFLQDKYPTLHRHNKPAGKTEIFVLWKSLLEQQPHYQPDGPKQPESIELRLWKKFGWQHILMIHEGLRFSISPDCSRMFVVRKGKPVEYKPWLDIRAYAEFLKEKFQVKMPLGMFKEEDGKPWPECMVLSEEWPVLPYAGM